MERDASSPASPITPRRVHLTRLLKVWRSGGWPCRDPIEIDLLAANWLTLSITDTGHEILRLTDQGIRLLAEARQANQRDLSAHDLLAQRMALQLAQAGRIVWRELSLRAQLSAVSDSMSGPQAEEPLWTDDAHPRPAPPEQPTQTKQAWRVARPDIFSVRSTSVEEYLWPMVHEVKVSRADLLSDLRHTDKRESYQWLSCETYYVFPSDVAEPHEIPEAFGVWTLHGSVEDGTLEMVRPARHSPCKLPFAVWMALAKSTPDHFDSDSVQGDLGGPQSDCALDASPDA